jgi:hypothetical protein
MVLLLSYYSVSSTHLVSTIVLLIATININSVRVSGERKCELTLLHPSPCSARPPTLKQIVMTEKQICSVSQAWWWLRL